MNEEKASNITINFQEFKPGDEIDIDWGTVLPCGGECGAVYLSAVRERDSETVQLYALLQGWGFIMDEGTAMACENCKQVEADRDKVLQLLLERSKNIEEELSEK